MLGFALGFTFATFAILASDVWVAVDSHTHHVAISSKKEYTSNTPALWFISCLLLWIAEFPLYLIRRSETLRVAAASGGFQGSASLATPLAVGAAPSIPAAASTGPSKYCAKCAEQLAASAIFCSRCGSQQPSL